MTDELWLYFTPRGTQLCSYVWLLQAHGYLRHGELNQLFTQIFNEHTQAVG